MESGHVRVGAGDLSNAATFIGRITMKAQQTGKEISGPLDETVTVSQGVPHRHFSVPTRGWLEEGLRVEVRKTRVF